MHHCDDLIMAAVIVLDDKSIRDRSVVKSS